jgi:hypothetical protein
MNPFQTLHAALVAGLLALVATGAALAQDTHAALKARHAALQPVLAKNAFGRPLHIESIEAKDTLRGEVHAVVAHPFDSVTAMLRSRDNWCDILILPFNVKQCLAPKSGQTILLSVGRKSDQAVADAHKVELAYTLAERSANHLKVQLFAKEGPLGTYDYRIMVEAIPIDAQRTFIHLSYSYGHGLAARVAMQAYLATAGSDKVGFSVTGRNDKGEPAYVKGVRGVVERNAMRYFLAIEAYLGAPGQSDRRLRDWFKASEQYALQLHEMDQADYLAMKTREVRNQAAAGS